MIHELKINPQYFEAVRNGDKRFELRKNDRDFRVGDYLALNEYDRATETYSGRTELVRIIYMMNPNDVMTCEGDFALMSIKCEERYNSARQEDGEAKRGKKNGCPL